MLLEQLPPQRTLEVLGQVLAQRALLHRQQRAIQVFAGVEI